ncbi:hypothetical protein ACVWZW_004289 [Bradyrhizobium sp. F1.13.4]
MPILVATSLLHPHPFEFAFRFGCVLVLALHFNDQRLLLCEPPFSFDDVALDLPQLIVYRRRVHRRPRAAVLPSTPQSSFRLLQSLIRAAWCGHDRGTRRMTFNSTSFANVPADAIFSQASLVVRAAMLLPDHFGGSGSLNCLKRSSSTSAPVGGDSALGSLLRFSQVANKRSAQYRWSSAPMSSAPMSDVQSPQEPTR